MRQTEKLAFGNESLLPLRGGNYGNQASAGVFALKLNNARSLSNANVGFRAALPPRQMPQPYGAAVSTRV